MNPFPKFPTQSIAVSDFFDMPVNNCDLGALGKGLFNQRRRIRIKELQPRQTHVEGDTINYKLSGKGWTTPCVVIHPSEGMILIDGHHTTVAKRLLDQKYIYANVFIFDPMAAINS